jgi:hypothetical protein
VGNLEDDDEITGKDKVVDEIKIEVDYKRDMEEMKKQFLKEFEDFKQKTQRDLIEKDLNEKLVQARLEISQNQNKPMAKVEPVEEVKTEVLPKLPLKVTNDITFIPKVDVDVDRELNRFTVYRMFLETNQTAPHPRTDALKSIFKHPSGEIERKKQSEKKEIEMILTEGYKSKSFENLKEEYESKECYEMMRDYIFDILENISSNPDVYTATVSTPRRYSGAMSPLPKSILKSQNQQSPTKKVFISEQIHELVFTVSENEKTFLKKPILTIETNVEEFKSPAEKKYLELLEDIDKKKNISSPKKEKKKSIFRYEYF